MSVMQTEAKDWVPDLHLPRALILRVVSCVPLLWDTSSETTDLQSVLHIERQRQTLNMESLSVWFS